MYAYGVRFDGKKRKSKGEEELRDARNLFYLYYHLSLSDISKRKDSRGKKTWERGMAEGGGRSARNDNRTIPFCRTRGVSLDAIQCATLRQIPAFQIVPFSFIHI